ncbi:hypothetical protein FORC066_2398 [Yersinia enterocolitica]|nr:hypothetical protein FORC065_2091 [Yersinia enterocolitica]UXD29609.1 hypothetical protein FORC066_2398 [Yersinia enterocolitica]
MINSSNSMADLSYSFPPIMSSPPPNTNVNNATLLVYKK